MNKKVIAVVGLAVAIPLLLRKKGQAAPPPPSRYSPVVVDSLGVNNPQNANGSPDGVAAYIYGQQGNFITLQVADNPVNLSNLSLTVVNPYGYGVTLILESQVSVDGVNWIEIPALRGRGVGTSPESWPIIVNGMQVIDGAVTTLPFTSPIKYVKIYQKQTGVDMGVDAVVAQPA